MEKDKDEKDVGETNTSLHTQATSLNVSEAQGQISKGSQIGSALAPVPAIDASGLELLADIKVHKDTNRVVHVTVNGQTLPPQSKEDTIKFINEHLGSLITDVA